MLRLCFFFFCCLLALQAGAQSTLQGFIYSEDRRQPVDGALVEWEQGRQQRLSDRSGAFSFELAGATRGTFRISHLGFEDLSFDWNLDSIPAAGLRIYLREKAQLLPSVAISNWVRAGTPMTYQTISKQEIQAANLGQDQPYLLQQTPSAVVSSDAGTGIGYTGMRIRGSDQTRINTTINGIPVNEAESQNVFWVDLPDIATSTQEIQIQRGVGSSSNGSGAFGATINLSTLQVQTDPYASVTATAGSFNLRRLSAAFGTGLLGKNLVFDGRISRITADGYIDRGTSDLSSYYASALWMHHRSSLRFITFSGKERTYQAWNGVPYQYLDSLRTFNSAGLRSDGSYYDNEVDDYKQTHYQLHFNHSFSALQVHAALHYTRGKGFYEQFRENDDFADYGFAALLIGDSLIEAGDLVRRRWLDNHFYGGVYKLLYSREGSAHEWTLGGSLNRYEGGHYGQVIWSQYVPIRPENERYYDNDALKTDWSTYLQWRYKWEGGHRLFADLQARRVVYDFLGINADGQPAQQQYSEWFINPKLGYYRQINSHSNAYISAGIAQREPNRDDFTESTPQSRPRSEWLFNPELGYNLRREKWTLAANLFWMHYRDQLVLTGKINDVGGQTRVNVPLSNRYGVEAQAQYQVLRSFSIALNAALSRNRIVSFTEYIDNWETGGQESIEHKNSHLSFSPELILQSTLMWKPVFGNRQPLEVALMSRYIGEQYLDNSSNPFSRIKAYNLHDLRLRFMPAWRYAKSLSFTLQLNNLFDAEIESNGWIYRFRSPAYDPSGDDPSVRREGAGLYQQSGWFPQAGFQVLGGISVAF